VNNNRLAAALLALLSVTGCGGGDEPAGEEAVVQTESEDQPLGENPYLEVDDLCARVPVEDVAAAAGGIEPLRSEQGTFGPASCRYFFDVADPSPRQASATLQMLSGFGLERIGAGERATDITGLGDEAWAHALTDVYLLYVSRGDVVFYVSVADDKPEVAEAIARVVLAAL